ncbi:MAG: transcriptional regulator NrdR [Clostridiales bacterium]|nr:transcriptional regulator NrdR [Clostridiales bacterium]
MLCPLCGEGETKVVETRLAEDGKALRRRRECLRCRHRFTTYERIHGGPLVVRKKDGRREPFQPDKLRRGITTACEKRQVPTDAIEKAVRNIEEFFLAQGRREVSSREIGEKALEWLRQTDDIAFIRFASVYLDFEDLNRFRQEIDELMKSKSR